MQEEERNKTSLLKVGRSPIDRNARLRGHETRCDRASDRRSQVRTRRRRFQRRDPTYGVSAVLFASNGERDSIIIPRRRDTPRHRVNAASFSSVEREDCTLRDDNSHINRDIRKLGKSRHNNFIHP